MQKKKISLILAASILATNIALTTSTATAADLNNATIKNNVNSSSNDPVVPVQTIKFDRNNTDDLIIKNIEFNGHDIKYLSVDTIEMEKDNDYTYDESTGTITIFRKSLPNDKFDLGIHALTVHFTKNGTDITAQYVNATKVNIVDSSIAEKPPVPDDNNTENGGNGGSTDVVVSQPEIESKELTFNYNDPKPLTVDKVKFYDTKLSYIVINGNIIYTDKLDVDTDNGTITIKPEALANLSTIDGSYSVDFKFANGKSVIGQVYLTLENCPTKKPAGDSTIVIKPTPEVPPVQDEVIDDSLTECNPTVENQEPTYNFNEPSETITIKGINFDGTKLNYLMINDKYIYEGDFIQGKDSVDLKSSALSKLGIYNGTYAVILKFSNGKYSNNNVYLTIENYKHTTEQVIFDKNNPTTIEIPFTVPSGSRVTTMTINNKVVNVEYRNSARAIMLMDLDASTPTVYIEDGKLIIPVETLNYIGLDASDYTVNATLDDGSTIVETLNLSVVDSSVGNKDEADKEDKNDNISNDNNSNNTTNSGDNTTNNVNNNTTNNSSNDNVTNNATSSTEETEINTVNKVESNNSTSSKKPSTNKVKKSDSVKTGDVAGLGLISVLLSSVAGITISRNKK